jgi:putative peptide zinc metalloprotease protein
MLVRLRLQDELIFTPQHDGDSTVYHVEYPQFSKFFRIGYAEYIFVSLLDGHTSVAEALSLTARALGPDAFSEQEATAICSWLIDSGLAYMVEPGSETSIGTPARRQQPSKPVNRLNPFWLKIPLFNPDRLLDRILPAVRWIHSGPIIALSLCLFGVAVCALILDWHRFVASANGVFAQSNWLSLAAAWLLLKLIHEFSHAIVCKKHGGEVREMGLILVLFTPMAYVDVTSSWRFRSKWNRIHTAVAGMYVELIVAAFVAILWSRTRSVTMSHLYFNIIFMASLTTLVFNANPLMRFDGYYILSDVLEIPNLYRLGQEYVRNLASGVFLGARSKTPPMRGVKGAIIKTYGIAAFTWRILVVVSLTIAASALFRGAGIALAVFGLLAWFGPAGLKLGRHLADELSMNPRRIARLFLTTTALGMLITYCLLELPWPGTITAPGIVSYQDDAIVRCENPGFIQQIHVQDGQYVQQGALLAELRNDVLESEYKDLGLVIEESEAKHRHHIQKKEFPAAQVELQNQNALKKRFAEKKHQLDSLIIRAPLSGRITARNLDTRLSTYLEKGSELLAIGDEERKELRVSVSQDDVDEFSRNRHRSVCCRIRSQKVQQVLLRRITPRATKSPPHEALYATNGGPLAVRQVREPSTEKETFELVTPRFTAFVELPPLMSADVTAGTLGFISLRPRSRSVGATLYQRLHGWIEKKVAAVTDERS